jgi:hypothetical protein
MEVTHRLGGLGYVFWGGREGYSSLLNTDMGLETANMARFLRMAADHKARLGFRGALMLEPKPQEPSKHQYDFDAATTLAFLRTHGLEREFMLNIECNHATLAGHSCHHELEVARQHGLLASLDANTGDPQVPSRFRAPPCRASASLPACPSCAPSSLGPLVAPAGQPGPGLFIILQVGWDTDQFLQDPYEATLVMSTVLAQGGLPLGINFDAKLRRESTDPEVGPAACATAFGPRATVTPWPPPRPSWPRALHTQPPRPSPLLFLLIPGPAYRAHRWNRRYGARAAQRGGAGGGRAAGRAARGSVRLLQGHRAGEGHCGGAGGV